VLGEVVERDPVLGAVAEERLDELREMAGGEGDAVEPVMAQLLEHDPEDWTVADRHEGFGDHRRIGPQSRSPPAGQDDRAPGHGVRDVESGGHTKPLSTDSVRAFHARTPWSNAVKLEF